MFDYFTVWVPAHLPYLLEGAWITLQLAAISMVLALLIGLAVAMGQLSGVRWLNWLLKVYLEIWRDIPLVVQLLVIYFSLPQLGLSLPAFWAGVIGLSLNLGAYLSEVFRSTISAVDGGQREAALSIGMSPSQTHYRIVFPQAFRIALPTLGGYFISLLKDCSLVSFIAVNELLRHGSILISSTFQSMETYLLVALIYFVMSFTASMLVRFLERHLTPVYLR